MDNLPNELLITVLNFLNSRKLLQCYQSTYVLSHLRPILMPQLVITPMYKENFCIRKLICINEIIPIPDTVKYLSIMTTNVNYGHYPSNEISIDINTLPVSVKTIEFYKSIELNYLTSWHRLVFKKDNNSLELMYFESYYPFRQSKEHKLPQTIKNLEVVKNSYEFVSKILNRENLIRFKCYHDGINCNIINLHITHIIPNYELPSTLKKLQIDTLYKNIKFPSSLKYLICYARSHITIDLPLNLIGLRFNPNVIQVLKFPSTLNKIDYHWMVVPELIPESVIKLSLNPYCKDQIIPQSVKKLKINDLRGCTTIDFPNYVTHLELIYGANMNFTKFPDNLTHLSIRSLKDKVLLEVPKTLTHLSIRGNFNNQIKFSEGLLVLICRLQNTIILPYLPSLQKLEFHNSEQTLNFPISRTLKFLTIQKNCEVPRWIKFVTFI